MKKSLAILILVISMSWFIGYYSSKQVKNPNNTAQQKMTLKNYQNKNNPEKLSNKTANNLYRGDFDSKSRADRLAIADDILKQVNELDSFIPNPTPDEINWIQTETDATEHMIGSARWLNLVDSQEFQRFKLKNYLATIELTIHAIKTSNLSDEMYWWSDLSSLLIDTSTLNDALSTLKYNNKFPSEIVRSKDLCIGDGTAEISEYNMCYHSFGSGILLYIVMPYLDSANNKLIRYGN